MEPGIPLVLAPESAEGRARASTNSAFPTPAPVYAPNRVTVKLNAAAVRRAVAPGDPAPLDRIRALAGLSPEWRLGTMQNDELRRARRLAAGQRDWQGHDWGRWYHLFIPAGMRPQEAVAMLASNEVIAAAQPSPRGYGGAVPSDPQYTAQWHLAGSTYAGRIRAPEAWDVTTGSATTIVAVLDTGIDTNLQELAGRLLPGRAFLSDYPALTNAWDDHGHGTTVASILAASANNASAGVGVDWNCRVLPVKVLDSGNGGYADDWAQGIDWAVDQGAKIINLSAGYDSQLYPDPTPSLYTAITNAIARGVIFVTITHNQGIGYVSWPGKYTEAITVGACDIDGSRATFSNFGPETDLVAPGSSILTTTTNGLWVSMNGTSFAAPLVAGTAALLCAQRPDLTQSDVAQLLARTTRDQVSTDPADTPGFDNYYGWGLLDSYAALLQINDVDADGMGDVWEKAAFGTITNSNGTADHDGDSSRDLTEYLAGTDPTNRASFFGFLGAYSTNDHPALMWYGATNRTYALQRATNPVPAFFPIDGLTITGTGTKLTFEDLTATGVTKYFYRLTVTNM